MRKIKVNLVKMAVVLRLRYFNLNHQKDRKIHGKNEHIIEILKKKGHVKLKILKKKNLTEHYAGLQGRKSQIQDMLMLQ